MILGVLSASSESSWVFVSDMDTNFKSSGIGGQRKARRCVASVHPTTESVGAARFFKLRSLFHSPY